MRKILLLLAFFPAILLAQPNTVSVGTTPNDGTGDPLRTAMQKLQGNDEAAFDSLESHLDKIETLEDESASWGDLGAGTHNLIYGNSTDVQSTSSITFDTDNALLDVTGGVEASSYRVGSSAVYINKVADVMQFTDVNGTMTKSQIAPLDSITVHRLEYNALVNRVRVLEGYDLTSPGVDSAYIQSGNDSVIIVLFDEGLGTENNDSAQYAFSFVYGIGSGSIDTVIVSGDKAYIYSSINIPSDSIVYVSYDKPISLGIHDIIGNQLESFSNKLAFNGVAVTYKQAFAYWKFNGTYNDEYGNYNGTQINNVPFLGDTAIYFPDSDGNDEVDIGNIITGDHSWSFWLKATEDADENYYLVGTGTVAPGTSVYYTYLDGTGAGTFKLKTQAADAADNTSYSESLNDITLNVWTHVVIIADVDIGSSEASMKYYINGALSYADTVLGSPFVGPLTVNKTTYMGNSVGSTYGFREGMVIGEAVLFNEKLTQVNIDSLYAIGGDRLWQTSSTPTPDDYTTDYVIYELIDFAGHIPQSTVPYDSMAALFDGALIEYSAGSISRTSFSVFGGDTVMGVYLPATAALTGSQVRAAMPDDYTEVWFGYDFYVPSNWISPNVSGKFPGISGTDRYGADNNPDGGLFPEGCAYTPTYERGMSFTMRTLIAGGWLESSSTDYAGFGTYLYHHDMPFVACNPTNKTYGMELYDIDWTRGQWNRIDFRIRMNTLVSEGTGRGDGILEIYKNGVCFLSLSNLKYRNYSTIFANTYFWAIFFGGGSDPERTSAYTAYFTNFTLWDFASGHGYAVGQNANPVGTVIIPPYSK